MKRDKDGRPVNSADYFAEMLAASLAGMTYDELAAERKGAATEEREK